MKLAFTHGQDALAGTNEDSILKMTYPLAIMNIL